MTTPGHRSATRLCLFAAINVAALAWLGPAAAASCSASAKESLMGRHAKQFESGAAQLKKLDTQLDKLCEYGRKSGLPMWTRIVAELGASAKACPEPIIQAVLQSQKQRFEDYKEEVATDCRNAAALKLDPRNAADFHVRGVAFTAKKDYDRAIADLTEAVRLDPRMAAAFYQRGGVLNWKGDRERALADILEAIRLDPRFGGNPFFADGDSDRKIAQYIAFGTESIRQDPKDAKAYSLRSLGHFHRGDFDASIGDAAEAIRLDPGNFQAFNNRSISLLQKGDVAAALRDLDEAIRLNAKTSALFRNRGIAYFRKGDLDRALADLDEAIRLDPKQQPAFAYRGMVHDKMGRRDSAIADFKTALLLTENDFLTVGLKAYLMAGSRLAALLAPGATANASALPAAPAPAAMTARPAPAAAPGRRIALAIGNSTYRTVAPLANPSRDAQSIAEALRGVGFEIVTLATDLPRDKFVDTLRTFAAEAEKADWAVIYFAGHGIEIGGTNYLLPVDARLANDRDVQFEAISLDQILAAVEGARKLRLVLLDSCRENPFIPQMRRTASARSVGRGLARVEPSSGTLVAYAARDGQIALDGDGRNSPFAVALLNRIKTPGVEINKLFRLVRDDVMDATQNRQEPYTYGALPGREDFYFVLP